jgi:hypothetical protein
MAALGIPTTRSLAAVVTGEMVARETLLPGAVLTRVASSHIRIGTFQYFAARGDTEGLRLLADHAIARHYPDVAAAEHPYRALLEGVVRRQADLIARWMLVGFIHGVMNTDNMSIAGETIDYGPCAFMDHYDPAMVFSSIDHHGRYAYATRRRRRLRRPRRFSAVSGSVSRLRTWPECAGSSGCSMLKTAMASSRRTFWICCPNPRPTSRWRSGASAKPRTTLRLRLFAQ